MNSPVVEITFKKVKYKIVLINLIYVLSRLENRELVFENEKQIKTLMKKYSLYDEVFLKSINRLELKN